MEKISRLSIQTKYGPLGPPSSEINDDLVQVALGFAVTREAKPSA
jgi:hypothetical protein